MRKLSLTIGILGIVLNLFAQSPHGVSLKIDCSDCHTTGSWEFISASSNFNHSTTTFVLEGQHQFVDCRSCHVSMVFSEAKTNCVDCHTDMHNNTLGLDCARCHTPKTWIIENVTDLHQQSRFPLLGAHRIANCIDCHLSSSNLDFSLLGVECIDCHRQDYNQTTNPNHVQANISLNCIECHKIDAMDWNASSFNHDFFPLIKGHEVADCITCHTSGILESIPKDCYSCHQADFEGSSNPSHRILGFSTTCEDCHTIDPNWTPATFEDHDLQFFPIYSGKHRGEWDRCSECHTQSGNYSAFSCIDCHAHNQSDMNSAHQGLDNYTYNNLACMACHPSGSADEIFDHNTTAFPLKGQHRTTICTDCHTQGFSNISSECVACHTENYNQALDPRHIEAGISKECKECHDENAWKPSSFNHTVTSSFELSGGHAGRQCSDCHIGTTTDAVNDCFACHKTNYNEAKEHISLSFSHNCLDCHNTTDWKLFTFDHNTTAFALTGSHVSVSCESCHTEVYAGTSAICNSCHLDNYNAATDPSHTGAGISTNCEDCHNAIDWKPSIFNHLTTSGFELSGGHSGRQCSDCHIGTTSEANPDCYSCHSANYTTAPDHLTLAFSHDCIQCHNNVDWKDAFFDHSTTNFPLTGAHTGADCNDCHSNGFVGTSALCESCHTDKYLQTNNPSHSNLGISRKCDDCHNTVNWIPSTFNHLTTSGFELSGGHSGRECSDCHTSNASDANSDCYSCHSANYASAPNHLTSVYPHDCTRCHNVVDWSDANFDHSITNFPLTGSHAGVDCNVCHTNGYAGTSTLCQSCHTDNYNQAINPSHSSSGISKDCDACHNTLNWVPSTFNHTITTGFALSGAHAGRQCSDCHIGTTTGASSDCYSCHATNYNAAPNHLTSAFPHDCLQCHNNVNWNDATFDHNTTNFPLTGSHIGVNCIDCHSNGYAGTSTDCYNCHSSSFNAAPNHLSSAFPHDCLICHNNVDWKDATFNHNTTNFPLTGAHISVDCASCHTNGYTGTSSECSACHQSNYNQTSNPNHSAIGLSTNCDDCHSTTPGWDPATFPIHNSYYALNGAHAAIATNCYLCHAGNYNSTPNTCYACHTSDYNGTTDPSHIAANFPTDCASCHSENAWKPATFNHDSEYFPIYSGKHRGQWNNCSDCHTQASNYSIFACINCHEHNKTDTDSHHRDVSGYKYISANCLSCHPTGRAD